jgi:hypothetical protein
MDGYTGTVYLPDCNYFSSNGREGGLVFFFFAQFFGDSGGDLGPFGIDTIVCFCSCSVFCSPARGFRIGDRARFLSWCEKGGGLRNVLVFVLVLDLIGLLAG